MKNGILLVVISSYLTKISIYVCLKKFCLTVKVRVKVAKNTGLTFMSIS